MSNENLHMGVDGLYLLKYFESCELTAYYDPYGQIWTIGWGHTQGVYEGMTITQEQADSLLQSDLIVYENYVKQYITVSLLQYEFDALTSFCYNAGGGSLQGDIANAINSGNKTGAMDMLMQYVHDNNGNVVQGLVNRRTAEKNLFLNDDLSGIGGTGTGGGSGGGGTGNYKVKNNYLYCNTNPVFGRKFTSVDKTFSLVSQTGDYSIISDSKGKKFKVPTKNIISV